MPPRSTHLFLDPREIVSYAGINQLTGGAARSTISGWRVRHLDFPEPLFYLDGQTPVWDKKEMIRWVTVYGKKSKRYRGVAATLEGDGIGYGQLRRQPTD